MARFGDNWATNHRNWRAIFAAISLGGLLLWALSLKKQDDARTFLRTDTLTAVVTDIKIHESDSRFSGKTTTYITYLTLPKGKDIRFMLLQKPPEVGSKIPVLVDVYDDGSQYYHYNQMDWHLL